MTFTGANDVEGPGGPCAVDMSVLDLAIFLRIHRSGRGTSAGEVAQTVGHWFDCQIDPREIERSFPRMVDAGWLVRRDSGMRAYYEQPLVIDPNPYRDGVDEQTNTAA